MSSRLELIKNLFNFHNSMSLRAKHETRLPPGFRQLNAEHVFLLISQPVKNEITEVS